MENETSTILSPAMLWRGFSANLPLQESKVSEEAFENIVYSDVYFSGRDVGNDRVRIFGVYARNREVNKKLKKAGLLIIPDSNETVDLSIINNYVKQGYSVLMIDYRGEWEGLENYTKYPQSISYANYKKAGRHIDYADETARQTSWFEWVAVARYGISFLKSQIELEKIGVIGIKNGANIGWQLCGTDNRIDCFVPLFGAGWKTYTGIYKYADKDIDMNDERLRFMAGVDAHSYAQYVKCPVFYMTATNCSLFDSERAMDTISRVPDKFESLLNFTPRMRDVLDAKCKRNVDLFLAKFLLGYNLKLPQTPKLVINCEDRNIKVTLDLDFSDVLRPKKVTTYLAEDSKNPAYRDWVEMKPIKSKVMNSLSFATTIHGNSSFVSVFSIIEYKNGLTVSSLMTSKKIPNINTRKLNLLYSSQDKISSFSVANEKKDLVAGVYFEDPAPIEFVEATSKISGVSSKYGLVIYKFNDRTIQISDFSLLKLDVNVPEYCVLKLTIVCSENEKNTDYEYVTTLNGGDIWQNVLIKFSDFKASNCRSIRDYSSVVALKLESNAKCIFNNILVV